MSTDLTPEEQLRVVLENLNDAFVPLATSNDTMSGYKLHVWCASVDDVLDVWKLVGPVVTERGLGAKAATSLFFERFGHTPQGHKGITVYLPKRASFQQDARAIVHALEGNQHTHTVEGDEYLSNGVSWRFELSQDPRRDVSLKTYVDLYAKAHGTQPTVPPLAQYTNMEFRVRGHDGGSHSYEVLQRLSAHRKELEALVRSHRENQPFTLQALDDPRMKGAHEPALDTSYDDVLADAFVQLGFDAESRVYAAELNKAAGVKITAGTGFPMADKRILSLVAPYIQNASCEVAYGKDRNMITVKGGELAIYGEPVIDLGATILRSDLPGARYESMALRIRGPNGESRSYEALKSLQASRATIEGAVVADGGKRRFSVTSLDNALLKGPKVEGRESQYDDVLVSTLQELGMEATPRSLATTGESRGVKITEGTGSFQTDALVFAALAPHARDTSFKLRYAGPNASFTYQNGTLRQDAGRPEMGVQVQ